VSVGSSPWEGHLSLFGEEKVSQIEGIKGRGSEKQGWNSLKWLKKIA